MIGLGMVEGIDSTVPKVTKAMEELLEIPQVLDFSTNFATQNAEDIIADNKALIKGGDTYNININQPVATPDEIARAIRTESQYGLIGGVSLA